MVTYLNFSISLVVGVLNLISGKGEKFLFQQGVFYDRVPSRDSQASDGEFYLSVWCVRVGRPFTCLSRNALKGCLRTMSLYCWALMIFTTHEFPTNS